MARIGIEWVLNYHDRAGNLSHTKRQAEGLYDRLSGVRAFNWGDDLAWDEDFQDGGSGTDSMWADNVDLVFFSGHGSPHGPLFGIADRNDGLVGNDEVRWGNKDLEWIVLDACQVLKRGGVFDRWGWPAFHGLHYVLGFHTTTSDEANRGRYLADYLDDGVSIRDAWIRSCQETEGSDTEWAYLRADAPGTSTFTDHWHGRGSVSADPVEPSVLYYLKGSC